MVYFGVPPPCTGDILAAERDPVVVEAQLFLTGIVAVTSISL